MAEGKKTIEKTGRCMACLALVALSCFRECGVTRAPLLLHSSKAIFSHLPDWLTSCDNTHASSEKVCLLGSLAAANEMQVVPIRVPDIKSYINMV